MTKHEFKNLNEFFEKVKSIGFIERLFFWGNVKSLSYDAYQEFKRVDQQLASVNDDLNNANNKIAKLDNDVEHLKDVKRGLESEKKELDHKNDNLNTEIKNLSKKISSFESSEEKRKKEFEEKLTKFESAKEHLDEERNKIRDEKEAEEEAIREKMKGIWKEHEDNVEQLMKQICSRHTIDYVDKVPFKGKPDNTLKICNEFVIFDAKSPRSDDLNNFPTYIKTQAEQSKKYAKIKEVKKQIFLVVPTNTIEVINQRHYDLVDYCVHVITTDALEPIILALRKVEDYEFMEQLSPEDREHICRIIGKFAHATKRRIQVDHFFANEFIDILTKCYDLPKDILDGTIEAEKSGILNPPMSKRAKLISTDDLKKDNKRIKKEAEAKDIDTKAKLDVIESVPLHKEE